MGLSEGGEESSQGFRHPQRTGGKAPSESSGLMIVCMDV